MTGAGKRACDSASGRAGCPIVWRSVTALRVRRRIGTGKVAAGDGIGPFRPEVTTKASEPGGPEIDTDAARKARHVPLPRGALYGGTGEQYAHIWAN